MNVGDWVVCVDASDDLRGYAVPLIETEVYQIAAIWEGLPNSKLGDLWQSAAFDLHGVPRLQGEIAYGAYRFRPLPGAEAQELVTAEAAVDA